MASESSDKKTCYMECGLRIETTPGWEKSLTKVLSSFEDLTYIVNPNQGFARIKGKTDPQLVLTQLKKGGKHASIDWITYGPQREEKDNQSHALESTKNNLYDYYNPYNYYLHNNFYGAYGYPNNIDHLGHKSSCHTCNHKDLGHDHISRHERRRSDHSRHRHHLPEHCHHSQEGSSSQTVYGPSSRPQPTHRQYTHQLHHHSKGTHLRTAMKAIKKLTGKLITSSTHLLGTFSNHASKMLCFKK